MPEMADGIDNEYIENLMGPGKPSCWNGHSAPFQRANPSKACLSPCVSPIPNEARFFHGERVGASQFIGS